MLETDPSSIIPVPVDRDSIYHYSSHAENQHEVQRYYLHVYARQGLPPVSSYISFENYKIGPGELSTLKVLSRFTARDYEGQERESDKTRGRKPY
ncbi:hypothetical protein LQW54_003102 [Pestalotiopsis sp. IQ-011]